MSESTGRDLEIFLGRVGGALDRSMGEFTWTARDLADIVWLAAMTLRGQAVRPIRSSDLPDESTAGAAESSAAPAVDQRADSVAEHTHRPPAAAASGLGGDRTAEVLLPPSHTEQTAERRSTAGRVTPLRSPAAPSLAGALSLARSLRPLKVRERSPVRSEVDVEATAKRIADEGIWSPVLRPASGRKYRIDVVVDATPSMAVWHREIDAFYGLLQCVGAFRDLRFWHLEVGDPQAPRGPGVLTLRSGGRRHSARGLADPTGRRIVLVASDCVGTAWSDGTIASHLRHWGKTAPVAILHMLPRSMWRQTNLGRFPLVAAFSQTAAVSNGSLRMRPPSSRPRRRAVHSSGGPVPRSGREAQPESGSGPSPLAGANLIPVFPMEPGALRAWAQVVTRGGRAEVTAYRLDTAAVPRVDSAPRIPGDLTPHERWKRFQAIASPQAVQLAALFAASPVLRLPVLRLVQSAMLPSSGQGHLAEVILGGLLRRRPRLGGEHPDAIEFQFHEGVREVLLGDLPVPDAAQVFNAVGRQIGGRLGAAVDFQSFVERPAEALDALDALPEAQPFALVASHILRHLGGGYARSGGQLDQAASGRLTVLRSLQHPEAVHRFAWAPEGDQLAVPLVSGAVYLWSTRTGRPLKISVSGGGANQVAWSPDGSLLAVSGFGQRVNVFSAPRAAQLWTADLDGDSPCLAFSPDGRLLAAGTMKGTLSVFDVAERKRVAVFHCGTAVWDLAWHPRAGLAVGGTDRILVLEGLRRDGREELHAVDELAAFTSCVAWTGDGRHLVYGNWEGELWVADGAELAYRRGRKIHDQRITGLSLSPLGGLVATRSEDSTVRLWRIEPWAFVGEVEEPVNDSRMYATVAFHPTARLLASADGRTVRIRSVPEALSEPAVTPAPLRRPRVRVLVAGTGRPVLPPLELAMARRLGRLLGERGLGLITGGWRGVDHVTARAFCRVIEARGGDAEDFLTNVLAGEGRPDYDRGRVDRVSSDRDSYSRSVELADAVVMIGGLGGTGEVGRFALSAEKLVLPLAATGGDSSELFDAAYAAWMKRASTSGDRWPRDLFERLRGQEPSAVDAIAECLAAYIENPLVFSVRHSEDVGAPGRDSGYSRPGDGPSDSIQETQLRQPQPVRFSSASRRASVTPTRDIPQRVLAAKHSLRDHMLHGGKGRTAPPGDEFVTATGIVGWGIAHKVVRETVTEGLGITVYVRRKLPASHVRPADLIPAEFEGVPTDVVETGAIRSLATAGILQASERQPQERGREFVAKWREARPVLPGASIGCGTGTGRIGCSTLCLSAESGDRRRCFLTCASALGSAARGDPVFQPGGSTSVDDAVGSVDTFVPIVVGSWNEVDAAAVWTSDSLVAEWPDSNRDALTPASPSLGSLVRQFTSKKEARLGRVTAVDVDILGVEYRDGPAGFRQVFAVSSVEGIFALPGDAGALVVEADAGGAVGLVFAGDTKGRVAFVCPMVAVMKLLRVTHLSPIPYA